MNKKLLKMMLAAVGIFAGTINSWGEGIINSIPVTEDFENGTGIFSGGTIFNTSYVGNVLMVNNGTAIATFDTDNNTEDNQPYTLKTNEKITIDYTAFHGWLSNGKNAVITIKNSEDKELLSYSYNLSSCQITNVAIGGTTVSNFTSFSFQSRKDSNTGANGFEGGKKKQYFVSDASLNPHITMTISGKGLVTIKFIISSINVENTFSAQLNDDFIKDISSITISNPNNNSDRAYSIDNLSITTETSQEETAAYTIKRICGDNVLSTETATGIVGTTPTLDTSNFYDKSDNNKKYVYVSNDAETIGAIATTGTTYTITYREAATFNYTVNAVDENGNALQTLRNGTFLEGESARAYYPKAININGKWYMTEGNKSFPTYAVDFEEEKTASIVYSLSDIAYYAEVEDINTSSKNAIAATGAYAERYSNGKVARLYKGAYVYTDAFSKTKTYTLYLWGRNNAGSSVANIVLGLRDSEGNITELENAFDDWDKGASALKSVEDVTIPAGYSLVLRNSNADYNSNLEMDYIYLVEQIPATVSANISAAKYATFVTDYNMIAPSTVKTYAVKPNSDNSGIVLSEIAAGTVIPANTALLLNAEEGSYNFTVSSEEAAKIENNALVAATTDVTATGNEYALTKQDGKVGFAQVQQGVVIPAGKAYLVVDNSDESAAKFFSFDNGEVTGINNVKTVNADNNTYYTLQGLKTQKPVKGMYIHNGKKIILK